jgi:hypothetical protein
MAKFKIEDVRTQVRTKLNPEPETTDIEPTTTKVEPTITSIAPPAVTKVEPITKPAKFDINQFRTQVKTILDTAHTRAELYPQSSPLVEQTQESLEKFRQPWPEVTQENLNQAAYILQNTDKSSFEKNFPKTFQALEYMGAGYEGLVDLVNAMSTNQTGEYLKTGELKEGTRPEVKLPAFFTNTTAGRIINNFLLEGKDTLSPGGALMSAAFFAVPGGKGEKAVQFASKEAIAATEKGVTSALKGAAKVATKVLSEEAEQVLSNAGKLARTTTDDLARIAEENDLKVSAKATRSEIVKSLEELKASRLKETELPKTEIPKETPVVETPTPKTEQPIKNIPVMITRKMEADLKAKGFTQEQINKMSPEVAWKNLGGEIPKAETVKVANEAKLKEYVKANDYSNFERTNQGMSQDLIELHNLDMFKMQDVNKVRPSDIRGYIKLADVYMAKNNIKQDMNYLMVKNSLENADVVGALGRADTLNKYFHNLEIKGKSVPSMIETGRLWRELGGELNTPKAEAGITEAISKIVESPEVSKGLTAEDKTVLSKMIEKDITPKSGGVKPPQPPVKKPGAYGFAEPEDYNIVSKASELIKTARKLSPEEIAEAELMRHNEKVVRVAKAYQKLKGGSGMEAFEKARTALGGEYPYPLFEAPVKNLSETDIKGLYDVINKATNSGKVEFFRGSDTQLALTKLLNGQMPTEREIKLLEEMFGEEMAKAIMSHKGNWEKFSKILMESLNIPRTLKASFDLSWPFRQGIMLAPTYPKKWLTAFGEQFKYVFSEAKYQEIDDIIKSNRFYGKLEKSGLFQHPVSKVTGKVSERAEEYMGSKWLEKIPGLGWMVRASERSFTGMGNKLRADIFYDYCAKWEHLKLPEKTYRELAEFLNDATGRGKLPKSFQGGTASLLNAAFFSPRYAAANLRILASPVTVWGKSPVVRKVIARNLLSFVGAGTGILMLLKYTGAAEVETDPLSADFGKLKVGNVHYNFWGGLQPWVRFTAQIIAEKRKSTTSGATYSVSRQDLLASLFRSKESPVFGAITDIFTGEQYSGEPIEDKTTLEWIQDLFMPMVAQDILESIEDNGVVGGLMASPSIFGLGVQTYGGDYWNENLLKLGQHIYSDTAPYEDTGKIYDMAWYYTQTKRTIGNTAVKDMEASKEQFDYPDLAIHVAEVRDIEKITNILPHQQLKSIDADSLTGYLDDKRITRREYDLLRQYNELTTQKEKDDFIEQHPELKVDRYDEWLTNNPEENAKLAVLGQAEIMTKSAYDEAQKLLTSWDIPESAIQGYFPTKEIAEYYYETDLMRYTNHKLLLENNATATIAKQMLAYCAALYSGNSTAQTEANRVRADSPELEQFMVDNGIWKESTVTSPTTPPVSSATLRSQLTIK